MMEDLSGLHMKFVAEMDRILDVDPDCQIRWQELSDLGIPRTFWKKEDKLFSKISMQTAYHHNADVNTVLKALAIQEKRRPYIR